MSQMTEAEAREEMWLDDHTYSALVKCAKCGDEAERLVLEDDGEAYQGCENEIGVGRGRVVCQSTEIARVIEQ